MTLVAILPALVCLVGLVLMVVGKGKPLMSQIGLVMFACGLLVTLFAVADKSVKLGL